jgi:hypothetical protein
MINNVSMVKKSCLDKSGKEYAVSIPSTNQNCGEAEESGIVVQPPFPRCASLSSVPQIWDISHPSQLMTLGCASVSSRSFSSLPHVSKISSADKEIIIRSLLSALQLIRPPNTMQAADFALYHRLDVRHITTHAHRHQRRSSSAS